jgi:GNAT superfamily N-acetyltransferase
MPSWRVREARADEEEAVRTCMLDILHETEGQKTAGFGKGLWDWQYRAGAHPALVVVAEDAGVFRGYFHVLVLDMRYRGRPIRGAMIQDVATMKAYRREGVLRAMDAFAREELERRGVAFILGFPNDRSLRGFTGEGTYTVLSRVPVHVCALDPGRVLAERFRLGAAGHVAGSLIGPVLRALRRRRTRPTEAIEAIARFDGEAEAVAREFASRVRLSLERSATYLNWRFVDKPTGEYALWTFRRERRLRAYVVMRRGELFGMPCVMFMDFGCADGEERALLRLIADRLEVERNAGAAAGVVVGLHPFLRHVRRLGFVRIPDRLNPRRLHFMARAVRPEVRSDLLDPRGWFVSLADWDVI